MKVCTQKMQISIAAKQILTKEKSFLQLPSEICIFIKINAVFLYKFI